MEVVVPAQNRLEMERVEVRHHCELGLEVLERELAVVAR